MKQALNKYWKSMRSVYTDPKNFSSFLLTLLVSLVVAAVTLKGFLELAEALREELLDNWDTKISSWIHGLREPGWTKVIVGTTDLGSVSGYLILIIIITWYTHHKEKGWSITLQVMSVLATAGLLSFILKFIIDRDRPDGVRIIDAGGLSFPSGHAMSSIAFYGFIIYLIWTHFNSKSLKISATVLLTLLIFYIGFTRVYLGVHYPSDVLAGFAAGLCWLAVCVWIFNLRNHRRLRKLHEESPV